MSASLNNGTITFGDGTIQSTKTPTITSAFTNDSGYTNNSSVAATYVTKANAVGSVTANLNHNFALTWRDVNGNVIGSAGFNCNCNC